MGLTPSTADALLASGVDVITSGNHIWDKREIYPYLESNDRVLRPHNYGSREVPGRGWGVYHALVAIGMTGSGMLDKVAGPVGEALIMTGIGLAVALPAVMGYNWLTRSNRVLTAKLDAFAFELLNFLLIGRTLQTQGRGGRPGSAPLAAVNY